MKSECYFENNPWDRVCEYIETYEDLSDIIAISIQVVCSKEDLSAKYNEYINKVNSILCNPDSTDILDNELCISAISKFKTAIVRIFIDSTDNEDWYDNFEIVTQRSLYIWKPSSRPQMHFDYNSFSNSTCLQKFSYALGGV